MSGYNSDKDSNLSFNSNKSNTNSQDSNLSLDQDADVEGYQSLLPIISTQLTPDLPASTAPTPTATSTPTSCTLNTNANANANTNTNANTPNNTNNKPTKKRNASFDVSRTMTRLCETMVGNDSPLKTIDSANDLTGSPFLFHEYDINTNANHNHNHQDSNGEGGLLSLPHLDHPGTSTDMNVGTNANHNNNNNQNQNEEDYFNENDVKVYEELLNDQEMGISSTPFIDTNHKRDYDTFTPSFTNDDQDNENKAFRNNSNNNMKKNKKKNTKTNSNNTKAKIKTKTNNVTQKLVNASRQIPAVALIAMFHLMIGIPFGVSYFPIGWKEETQFYKTPSSSSSSLSSFSNTTDTTLNDITTMMIDGPFPIQGKNSLGIRMFLFSTLIGQMIFTFQSGFKNPIGLQMVENVPFCQALAAITIKHCGYGIEALSTLFVMFGLSSIIVGLVFYTLGKFQLGRIIYYFPSHVLVGLIAGIGIFISRTGIEVTMDTIFSMKNVYTHIELLMVVLFFELFLRMLERLNVKYGKNGKPVFSLLSPIYFCSITPVFYFALWVLGVGVKDAEDKGFFFPSLVADCGGGGGSSSSHASSCSSGFLEETLFNKDIFDMWRVIDFSNVSWAAIVDSIPTLIAITIFSLIHVPINIPAFAISTNSEYDMNQELVAHGYSNCISGLFGGLQNYMAYTQSILYDRSGGYGKPSGVAVTIVTLALFVLGPTIASYIPRCMAGTLLVHVGIDLFLEGVYDTAGKFERLEYGGIWLIAVVMTFYGMDAAMIAGAISAVATYAVQTVAYLDPVRGHMSAATLRSSQRNHGYKANSILESVENGRSRILVIQLQGHLFFGNVSQLNRSFNEILSSKKSSIYPRIVIVDFSLVLGIDSSAAQAIVKLKKVMLKKYKIQLCVFVPGSSDGFPCEYDLSKELYHSCLYVPSDESREQPAVYTSVSNEETAFLMRSLHNDETFEYKGSQVCQTLDFALVLSENALITWYDPELMDNLISSVSEMTRTHLSEADERKTALYYLRKIYCRDDVSEEDIGLLFSFFERETYKKDELIWKQGAVSDCAKVIVCGKLIAMLENEAGTYETVQIGRMVGELGLVAGVNRMNSVYCMSESCIVYSISRTTFEEIVKTNPKLARIMDLICIEYLADRVQHVSNRIFETRCLPI